MTEQEYSNVRALSAITYAYDILADICVPNVPTIDAKKHRQILIDLNRIRENLFVAINTEESSEST